ncbi:MAG: hypothetical protein R2735_02780 [Microthrixaceae bacterium]
MDLQSCAGDDTEGPLRTDEELVQIGADSLSWVAAGGDGGAICEDDVKAHDDVLDLSVARRELACATACQPASDSRQVHRLWPVASGVSGVAKRVFVDIAESARQYIGEQRRLVDVADPIESTHVELHAAEERDRCAQHSGTTGTR